MGASPWIPWHQVVKLRENVRSGALSLSIFAADLNYMVRGKAQLVYRDQRDELALIHSAADPRLAAFEERSLLESISNHVNARAAGPQVQQPALLGGGIAHR